MEICRKEDIATMKHYRTASIAALMLGLATLPALSHAQYMWLDEKGLKQLSDQPPPLSVPQNRILKQPRGQGVLPDAVPAAAAEGAPEAPEAKVKRPPTLADRNADFAKRKAESQAAEQKAAEESSRKSDLASNCAAARADKAALDSGSRIAQYDKDGQRSVLNDEQRAERSKRNQKILADCAR
jgi:type IV secretory pathway VirB10-like protein